MPKLRLFTLLLGVSAFANAGTVTFSNPSSASTTATFSSPGTYTITCTVSDGVSSGSSQMTITVQGLPAVLSAGSVPGIGGNTVTVPITLSSGTTGIAALQFDVVGSANLTPSTVTVGPVATAAGKSVATSMVNGNERVIISGLNQNVMGSGVIANVAFALSPSLASGTQSVDLTNLSASDINGTTVPMTGTSGSIIVTANQPPTVTISGPSNLTLPNDASLSATATDIDSNRTITYQWSGQ